MFEEMIHKLDRLVEKYSADDWSFMGVAQDLVSLLSSHRDNIQDELKWMQLHPRYLKDSDFLGPKERKKRKIARIMALLDINNVDDERVLNASEDYSEYFNALVHHLLERRRRAHKEEVMKNERLRRARHLNGMKKDVQE